MNYKFFKLDIQKFKRKYIKFRIDHSWFIMDNEEIGNIIKLLDIPFLFKMSADNKEHCKVSNITNRILTTQALIMEKDIVIGCKFTDLMSMYLSHVNQSMELLAPY